MAQRVRRDGDVTIELRRAAGEHRRRLRDRRAAHARRRRLLGLAGEPDEHRHRDPRTCPSRRPQKRRRRRWLCGSVGLVARRAARRLRASARRTRSPLGLGVSLVILGAGAARCGSPGVPRPRGRTPAAGLVLVAGSCCRSPAGCSADLKMRLLDLRRRRADDRDRRDLGDHVQRRRPARRRSSASLGRIRALAPVLRMSIAYPLRSLFRTGVTLAMFTLVVFTLVVGATITGSFVERLQRRRGRSAAASTSAPTPRRSAPIDEHARGARGTRRA